MEKLSYMNLPNCYKLSNGVINVIVSTDVGPRILYYGFPATENILGEIPDRTVRTELGDWKPWGGHRLWAAPEIMPRTKAPDNRPVEYQLNRNGTIRLTAPVEAGTGLQKEMSVSLDGQGSGVTVRHKITNRNAAETGLAAWALTIMNGGGVVILPQEPFRSHDDYLLPARPLVLWHYTDLSDPRFTIGQKFICLRSDETRKEPQKIGIANKQGWAAYHRNDTLFVKRYAYDENVTYTDFGSNTETYTAGSFIELETLGPMQHLKPGESTEHLENWRLFSKVHIGATEETIEESLLPLLAETSKTVPINDK